MGTHVHADSVAILRERARLHTERAARYRSQGREADARREEIGADFARRKLTAAGVASD